MPEPPVVVEVSRRGPGGADGVPPAGFERWVRILVRLLDDAVEVPGTRFRVGLDPVLGFLAPGFGDVLTGLLGLSTVVLAVRDGAPLRLVLAMVGNVLLDLLVGFLPVVGDVADLAFRAHRRNLLLLDAHREAEVGRIVAPGGAVAVPWYLVALPVAIVLVLTFVLVAALFLSAVATLWLWNWLRANLA